MLLAALVAVSARVAGVAGRLEKTGLLAELLRQLEPAEIDVAIAFLSGSTRQGRVGIGHAAIAAGADVPAASSPTLTLLEVDRVFATVAAISGQGSARARSQALRALFGQATADEQEFLRRLLYGELRQGALEGVLVDAVARAANVPAARVRRAAMMAGDLGPVANAALVDGDAALDAFVVQLMRPVQPMLAESEESVGAAMARAGDASLEYKIDGARIQVHKAGDEVRVYSRALRDLTPTLPEIVGIARRLPVRDTILDGEAIALKPDGRPEPFQVTMRRFGQLTPFFFDVLYADAAPLIDEPQERRIEVLERIGAGFSVPRIIRPTVEDAEAFAREAAARGHEGIMAKSLTAPYAAGRRGAAWLKVKQARTLDLVVLAAEWGHGRRRGWLSNLHLGARDPERNGFVMLGKTFKGLTDQMLAWQTEHLLALEIGRDAFTVHVRPELVVEIAFNEIQDSPVYPGGVALRFARVKRYRTDKMAADADTIAAVRAMK